MSGELPVHLTRFIGREREIAEVETLLDKSRLVTLTGPGGSGKTRLAIEVARRVANDYPHGVIWAELLSLSEETPTALSQVAQAVATSLGLQEHAAGRPQEALVDFIAARKLLLLMDNCEHLLEECARLTSTLLRACPNLHVLATSLAPLGVAGEKPWPVPPLSLPPAGPPETGAETSPHSTTEVADLNAYESIALFLDRAAAALPGFALTSENSGPIAALCRHLDGMPLAIELAAARVTVLSVQQIAARLGDRFALLVSSKHAIEEPRHATLRGTIDWSYALLTGQEQQLFRRLAVFESGCTLESSEAICKGDGISSEEILDLLASLVEKSLLRAETIAVAQARYRMLESIRDYALDKLADSSEAADMRDRHLEWFAVRVEEIGPKLRGIYQKLWLNWLEAESDNMRSALAWSLDGGRLEVGLRLAVALYDFWLARGHLAEGRAWSSRLLARSDESLPPILRARANMTVGHFSWLLGDYDAGGELQAAIDLAEAAGEPGKPALAAALMGMSSHIRATGDYGAAYRLCRRSVQLNRELGSTQGLIPALMLLAVNASGLGRTEEANSLLQQALALAQDQDDTHRVAMVLKVMGDLAYVESDYSQAQALYEDSLDKFGELGQANDVIGVSNGLAAALLGKGELKRAFELLAEGLRQQRKAGNIRGLAEGFVGLGALADMSHRPDVAVPLLAAATTRGGPSLLFSAPALKLAYERHLASAAKQLPPRTFERLQGQGRLLALDKAIQLALSLDSAITSTRGASPSELDRLTQRQRQVAALVAHGMSNEEIAQELVISKRTVEKHISDIFSRLDMGDRTQLVLWAIEQGLTSSTV